jgi:hypothetical protein
MEDHLKRYAKDLGIAITGTIVHGSSEALPTAPRGDPLMRTEEDVDCTEREAWIDYLVNVAAHKTDVDLSLINEAFYIDASGEKIGSYTKKNLWHPER